MRKVRSSPPPISPQLMNHLRLHHLLRRRVILSPAKIIFLAIDNPRNVTLSLHWQRLLIRIYTWCNSIIPHLNQMLSSILPLSPKTESQDGCEDYYDGDSHTDCDCDGV